MRYIQKRASRKARLGLKLMDYPCLIDRRGGRMSRQQKDRGMDDRNQEWKRVQAEGPGSREPRGAHRTGQSRTQEKSSSSALRRGSMEEAGSSRNHKGSGEKGLLRK